MTKQIHLIWPLLDILARGKTLDRSEDPSIDSENMAKTLPNKSQEERKIAQTELLLTLEQFDQSNDVYVGHIEHPTLRILCYDARPRGHTTARFYEGFSEGF